MKQVEGVTKEDYIKECRNDGGVPILYANMQEAVIALCEYTRTRKYNEFELSKEDAEAGIRNSSNCDWILMDDGSVLWRRYPKIEEERAKSGNVKLRTCRKKAGLSRRSLRRKPESVSGFIRTMSKVCATLKKHSFQFCSKSVLRWIARCQMFLWIMIW